MVGMTLEIAPREKTGGFNARMRQTLEQPFQLP